MADLGFSGVVEKFEEHWGTRATRWLLLTIGLGVAAICVGAIWQWLVAPVLAFLGSPQRSQTIWSLALAAFGIGGGVSLGSAVIAAVAEWRRLRSIKTKIEVMEGELAHLEARGYETVSEARGLLDESKGLYGRSRALLIRMLDTAEEMAQAKSVSAETRAEISAQLAQLRRNLDDHLESKEGGGLGSDGSTAS